METAVYDRADRESVDELVREYLPLVKKIGLHLVARLPPDIELDDMMQVGMMGLIQASSTYDATQGASFSTYAGIRIKGAMLDEVRRNDWKPRSVQQSLKKVSTAINTLESRLGRSVTDAEIARELDMALEDYHDLSRELVCSRMTSLDGLEGSEGNYESDEVDPFANLEDSEQRKLLADAIKSLPEKEMLMMSLYYAEELNLKEIGEVMGVSESRVSQIHGQALARVRVKVAHWSE
ncbi:MAG: RNA polymerase sigma factor for flagellar operon FliA [Halioglobus sp.]|jgi:RNA polymerase sigma factor for flagellar operon FliA